MIPGITELNFPSYATLHSATVSLADMGDKTITTKVKIDGAIPPEFIGTDGEDWAVEFMGEKYIQPLRIPQATKDNSSLFSSIELTFQHWAIYQMQRVFFVALANIESSTPIADKYIVSLAVSLPEFAKAIHDILNYYFPDGEIYVYEQNGSYINPEFTDYDPQTKYVEIDYSYVWDVLQKTYELYECRWTIEKDQAGKYAIKFGYPVTEQTHIFQYGYEGGLLSIQRQVQDDNIRNQILGRGGEKNLPYMYFKDYEKFHPNSDDSVYKNYGLPDPDAIPELENILFSELRSSNFRSYIQGWKVNPRRKDSTADGWSVTHDENLVFTESDGTTYSFDAQRAEEDWAYAKGASDVSFDPVEYVKDDESIATYGLLQGGLDNNEDIFPTLQGMKLELPCIITEHGGHNVITLADELVDAEEVETDEISAGGSTGDSHIQTEVSSSTTAKAGSASIRSTGNGYVGDFSMSGTVRIQSKPFASNTGYLSNILNAPEAKFYVTYERVTHVLKDGVSQNTAVLPESVVAKAANLISWNLYDADTDQLVESTTNLPENKSYYLVGNFSADGFSLTYPSNPKIINGHRFATQTAQIRSVEYHFEMSAVNDQYNFYGEIIPNTTDEQGVVPISASHSIAKNGSYTFELDGNEFVVPEPGAMVIDVPITVTPEKWALVEKTLKIAKKIGTDNWEYVVNSNLSAGTYKSVLEVKVKNNDGDSSHTFTVTLQPNFVYFIDNRAQWQPTFDIWVKNIFETDRSAYEGGETGDDLYTHAVWEPLVSTQEMTITFATGNLSRHSDWEFKVAQDGIHYDNSKTLIVRDDNNVEHEVRSEWRITLIKSDAEADSIHKYVPYKDFNAAPYDRFFFTNIYLPWAYVYAAENALTLYLEAYLEKSKDTIPTWVVSLDKIRANELDFLGTLHVGDMVKIKDDRFTPQVGIQLYIQTMTITWQEGDIVGIGLPNIEITLSDKVETSLSSVAQLQGSIEDLSTQIKGIGNLERSIRRVADALYLRKDGVEDTSYSPTTIARDLKSENFRHGAVGGSGWSAYQDEDGKAVAEYDKLIVRDELIVNSLVANQISAEAGKEILSAASIEVSQVVTDMREDSIVYVCYFEQRQGSIANLFVAGDVAFSQVFSPENNETKYYKRRVIEVGPNYIVLSDTDVDGQGTPTVGDLIVQYGNYTNPDRQFVIIRDVIGGGYERMISGLNSVTATGKEYYYAGKVPGQTPDSRWFVGDADGQYAEFKNGELFVNAKTSWYDPDDGSVTTVDGGVVMSSLLGVANNGDLVAGLNASELGEDSTHGKLMIFAGADGEEHVDDANTRIYEDGYLFAQDANISGHIEAETGKIGGFELVDGYLRSEENTDPSVMHPADIRITANGFLVDSTSEHTTIELEYNTYPASTGDPVWNQFSISTEHSDPFPGLPKKQNRAIELSVTGNNRLNFAIFAKDGMYGGLRLLSKVITTANSVVDLYDERPAYSATNATNVYMIRANNVTLNLPADPQDGQMYMVYILYRGPSSYYKTVINGGKKNIYSTNSAAGTVKTYDSDRGLLIITYNKDDDAWYIAYVNKSAL